MAKFVIYQVLPRTFVNYNTTRKHNGSIEENGCGKLNNFTPKALKAIRELGVTHVWYTGLIEHATQTDYSAFGIRKDHPAVIKGRAGSPYAIKDYYDIDPDLAVDVPGRMKEFEALVNRTHRAHLKMIIDFVPNHVARQYFSDVRPNGVTDLGENDHPEWAFSPLNNFYYIPNERFQPSFDIGDYEEFPAKATGNDQFHAHPSKNDWYETVKLNYGVFYQGGGEKQFDPIPDTWNKMLDILLFWAGKGVDGFRCDMAEMVPVEFWHWVIPQVKEAHPDCIFIGEVYKPELYRNYLQYGNFDYLYDKVGMYDKLRAITSKNHAASDITHMWQAVDDIKDNMLNFLENHDEQRIASGFFCGRGLCAEPAMIVAATLTRCPIMIYAGQELGEVGMDMEGFSGVDGRTSIFDYWGVRSIQAWTNGGKFDGALLDSEQRELQDFYRRLLNITLSEKAVTKGDMYDLEYAQTDNFSKHKHFTYIRKCDNEVLLFVLNFDDKDAEIRINIPREAFSYLDMPSGCKVQMVDILNSQDMGETVLSCDKPLSFNVARWTGRIVKFSV